MFIITFILGTVYISSVMCIRHRHKRSSWFNSSHCDHCHALIPWVRLIPIAGFFINKGRCSSCNRQVCCAYPFTELCGGLWAIVMMIAYDQQAQEFTLARGAAMIITGTVFAFIIEDDILHYRIRNHFTLIIALEGVWLEGQISTALILGAFTMSIAAVFRYYRGSSGLGRGDIKLLITLGLWLPLTSLPAFLIIMGMLGIGWGLLWRHLSLHVLFPLWSCYYLGIHKCLCFKTCRI